MFKFAGEKVAFPIGMLFLGILLLGGCDQAPQEPAQPAVTADSLQGAPIDSGLVEPSTLPSDATSTGAAPAAAPEPPQVAADPVPATASTAGGKGASSTESVPAVEPASMAQAAQAASVTVGAASKVASSTAEISKNSPLSGMGGPILSDPSKFRELAKTGEDEGDYKFVPFDLLSGYEYYLVPVGQSTLAGEDSQKDQIPPYVRDLNNKKVVIEGYMVPIDVEGERIKSFILTNSMMMCCYGAMPWINEWIFVEMENEDGADFYNDVPIKVQGEIEVGEEIEDGMVISLYRMKGHHVRSSGEPTKFLYDY